MASKLSYAEWKALKAAKPENVSVEISPDATPEDRAILESIKAESSSNIPEGKLSYSEWKAQKTQEQQPERPEQTPVMYGGRNVRELSAPAQFLLGTGESALDLARGAQQMTGLGDQEKLRQNIEESRRIQAALGESVAGKAGTIFGQVAPAVMTGGASLPAVIGSSAAYGALQPTAGEESRIKNIGMSALGGLAGAGITKGLGKLVGGATASKQAKELMEQGIQPTLGQGIEQGTIGKAIRTAEESSTSLPILGAITRHARERASKEWTNEVFKRVEIPGEISAKGKIGLEGIDELQKGFNKSYTNALAGHEVKIKPELANKLRDLIDDPDRYINPEDRKWAESFISKQFSSLDQKAGKIDASKLKELESNIGAKSRGLVGSLDKNQAELGQLLGDVEDAVSGYRASNIPAAAGAKIKELDKKYASFKRLQRASTMLGAEEGQFTPAQLLNAVKVMDKSKDKGRFATRNALLQDIASSGKTVLSNKLGESGTSPRTQMANLAKGSAEATAGYFAGLPLSATIGSAMFAGSQRPVQKFALGGYPQQRAISEAVNRLAFPASALGAYQGRQP